MKLYPKARPVRIKLNVGGEEHSSLDSLRANFNVEEVLKLYESGGLQNWLRQINRLDILEQMDKIHTTDYDIEKYRKCILIFFEYPNVREELQCIENEKSNALSLNRVLMDLCYNYPSSFNYVFSSLVSRSSIEYYISVEDVRMLIENDSTTGRASVSDILRRYLYENVRSHLNLIRNVRLNEIESKYESSSEKDNNSISEKDKKILSEQLKTQWQINLDEVLNPENHLEDTFHEILEDSLLSNHKETLQKIIEQIDEDYRQLKEGFSDVDRSQLLTKINLMHSAARDILMFNLRVHTDCERVLVFTERSTWSFNISDIWYKLPGLTGVFDNKSKSTDLIDKWSEINLYVYLYALILRDGVAKMFKNSDYYSINSFLSSNKGLNGFYFMLQEILKYCNETTISQEEGIRKKIMQSTLMVGILCNKNSSTREEYLRMLHRTGYTPATLLLGLRSPVNSIEGAFWGLGDIARIPFIAEHILDF